MATTIKRITVCLTKEELKIINELMEKLGEGQAQVIRRALIFYKLYEEQNRK